MGSQRFNNQFGLITDNPLTPAATTFNSPALATFPAVAAPNYARITLDPGQSIEEVVWIMAHAANSTTATIWRGREQQTNQGIGLQHSAGATWVHAPTAADAPSYGASNWMQLPPSWNDTLIQSLYTGSTTIAGIGMSVQVGMQSTAWLTKGYIARLQFYMEQAGYPSWYDFWDAKLCTSFSAHATMPDAQQPFTVTANGTYIANTGLNFTLVPLAGNTPNWRFRAPRACIGLDVIYLDTNSSSGANAWGWSLDSGAQTGQVITTGGNVFRKLSITGLASSNHTLDFNSMKIDANNYLFLVGVVTYYAASGVGYVRTAYAGMTEAMHSRGDGTPSDKHLAWQGNIGNGTAAFAGPPFQPDAFIIESGANDAAAPGLASGGGGVWGAGRGEYFWSMGRRIDAIRRAKKNASGIVVTPKVPFSYSDDYQYNTIDNAFPWQQYIYDQQSIAQQGNCALYNAQEKEGPTGVADGNATGINFHPTDQFHDTMGKDLFNIIST
jgi:hypothetical protein